MTGEARVTGEGTTLLPALCLYGVISTSNISVAEINLCLVFYHEIREGANMALSRDISLHRCEYPKLGEGSETHSALVPSVC